MRCVCCSLVIICLQHSHSPCNCFFACLAICDSDCVLLLLSLTHCSCLRHCLVNCCNGGTELTDLLSKFGNISCELLNVGLQGVRLLCFGVTSRFVGPKLRIAKALVLCLLLGLFGELRDHVLDHLYNLFKRVCSDLCCEQCQDTAVLTLSLVVEVCCNYLLDWACAG